MSDAGFAICSPPVQATSYGPGDLRIVGTVFAPSVSPSVAV